MTDKNMPEKKFSAGPIVATVWKNTTEKNGKAAEYYTVSLDRRYKDRNDKWQSTNSMRVNDLPKITLVAQKAYEYLILKEPTSAILEEDIL